MSRKRGDLENNGHKIKSWNLIQELYEEERWKYEIMPERQME